MHSHERYTSESSNATNSSGCTEQTYISGEDDVTSDSAINAETYTEQAVGCLGEKRNATALGFNSKYALHKEKTQLSMGNNVPGPKQSERIPLRRFQSEVSTRDLGYIQESSPLLDFIEYRRSFESMHVDLLKLKRNYKNLRRMFLILAFLCIILIICVISVLPVILVSFRMDNNNNNNNNNNENNENSNGLIGDALKEFVFGQLHSQRAKGIIQKHIFCSKCHGRGSDTYNSKSFEDPRDPECCHGNVFSDFITFKEVFTEKLQTHYSDMRIHYDKIVKLEDAVIALQYNGSRRNANITSSSSPSSLEKSVLQGRMENLNRKVDGNNKLLNKLLGWKRSSMQLKGTVTATDIEWQQDILNGNIMSIQHNKLQVKSGGTYFIYITIQFTKTNCTKNEEFQYALMKDRGMDQSPIARVKHTCTEFSSSSDFTLNLQKIVQVNLEETALFYLKVSSKTMSRDIWAHTFGIIEL